MTPNGPQGEDSIISQNHGSMASMTREEANFPVKQEQFKTMQFANIITSNESINEKRSMPLR